jgi:hypothetical protein
MASQIDMVKIRAKIELGTFTCETPYILRFSVSRGRTQYSTFDASMKVDNSSLAGNLIGENIVISAGENSPATVIFTGFIKQAQVNPCKDDPSYVILNISGADKFSYLEGKKYTRRCRATKGAFVTIDSVQRKGMKSGKLSYVQQESLDLSAGDHYLKEQHHKTPVMVIKDRPTPNVDTSKRGADVTATVEQAPKEK